MKEGEAHDDLLIQLVLIDRGEDDSRPVLDDAVFRDDIKGFGPWRTEHSRSALTYTWYLLAKHPDAAKRVYEDRFSSPLFDDPDRHYMYSIRLVTPF